MGKRKGEEAERAGSKIWEGKERKQCRARQTLPGFLQKRQQINGQLELELVVKIAGV